MEDQISELKKEITDLKYILYSIIDDITYNDDHNTPLKYEPEYLAKYKTYTDIPDNLDLCYVDIKNCLYRLNDEDDIFGILLGYLDHEHKKFYKINKI
jgi:hypothetical protein